MATTVIVGGIDPNLKILGNIQSLLFSQANSGLWLVNSQIPTSIASTLLDTKFINPYQKGYSFGHVTNLTNQQGVFCFSSLQYQNDLQNSGFVSTNLMTFNELENNKFNFYKPIDMLTNNITTKGEISVETGTLVGNTLKAFNQININVTSALFVNDDGNYKPYNGNYAFLSANANVGIGIVPNNPYSINCNNRIKASEFNAVSSKEIKNILAKDLDIDKEALEIFKKISFSKYQYKDKLKNGSSTVYGLIAEDLFSVMPDWVNEDFDFVPNIMAEGLIIKIKNNIYELLGNFNYNVDLKQNKLKIIGNNKSYVVSILEQKQGKLIIKTNENEQDIKSEKKMFVYGTYKKCPSVTKNNVFELGLVVLKGLIKRLENLEEKYG